MKAAWLYAPAIGAAMLGGCPDAAAKIDLVTLPERDSVQLTIYNSADLTLARERRDLTLRQGINRLQFSWANTLIDPTSLDLLPKAHGDAVDVLDLMYPPRVRNLGVWRLDSSVSGDVPVEINYLTSGLSWRAFYTGTLSSDERHMRLQGYVRVQNNSGEDYANAQVRLVVGKVHLIDQIAELARREHPFGMPMGWTGYGDNLADADGIDMMRRTKAPMMAFAQAEAEGAAVKEIRKEGLSEYFLYTIEGTESIPNGWAKRLPSFTAEAVPVEHLYKFEVERYGNQVVRFLSFKNDTDHDLGDTPIPGGALSVFRTVDDARRLGFEGHSSFQYIPVGEDVELNMGAVQTVIVEPNLMDTRDEAFQYDQNGNISGWETVETYEVEVKNTRELPVRVSVTRNIPVRSWELDPTGEYGAFEKVDRDTVKFTLNLDARSEQTFGYVLRTRHGLRAD